MKINSVVLTTKIDSKQALALCLEISSWLEERGIMVRESSGSPDDFKPDPGRPAPDLIIILGGDGTILSRARNLLDLEIPFLGVNLGQVGFMAEISPDSWKDQLETIIKGDLYLSARVVLGYELIRDKQVIERGCAINEVAISRGHLARLITVALELPGGVIQKVRSDGIILSTPTGSTAYSVSAGGPLVHPELEVFVITPICPFLHDFKPLVLPSGETVFAGISLRDSEAWLTVDGQLGFMLKPGDRLRIFRHDKDFKILCNPVESFSAKLVAKGFIKRR
jgi:NAD+ kinase